MTSIKDLLNQKKQQYADKVAGSKNAYRFKQKKTTIRILPGWRGAADPTFFHNFGQTWIKDMDGKVMAAVGDAKITFGQDDAVRNLVQRAIGEARTDAQRQHYKEMLASSRVLVNALVLDDKDVDPNVPQIVEFSETQFTVQIAEQLGVLDIEDEFLDLENGFDLIVSKEGTGFQTKYTFTFARKARKVDPAIMEQINDIDAFIRAKFAETERAVNALKSLTQGETLMVTDRSTDMHTRVSNSDVVDADYDAVDDARNTMGDEPVTVETHTVSEAEIDALFD